MRNKNVIMDDLGDSTRDGNDAREGVIIGILEALLDIREVLREQLIESKCNNSWRRKHEEN